MLGERRANVRLCRVLAAAIESGGEWRNCVAVDLSITGFQVVTSLELKAGQLLPVKLHLANHEPIAVTAQVVWCQQMDLGFHRVGFQVEQVSSQEDFERLCNFVEKEGLGSDGLREDVEHVLDLSTQISLRTMSAEEIDRFAALAKVSEMLNGSPNLENLLEKAVRVVVEVTGAERGMILLNRASTDSPVFHSKSINENRAFSKSVVEKVLASKKPLLSLDAQRDDRLSESSSLRIMGTRSVLCVPILGGNRYLGTLYLDNSIRAGALNQSDLKLATVLASITASAIERTEAFAQLVQSEKLAAMGTLTASFLHELGGPLTSIMGLGEMLHEDSSSELTELLLEETKRCDALVSDLLRVSRREPVEFGEVDIVEVVRATTRVLAAEFRRHQIEVCLQLSEKTPKIYGHAAHIRQIVQNLLTNAIHATSDSGLGRVEVRTEPDGSFVRLSVLDNGPGVPPAVKDRIFDPFFTTKPKESGTGLGLAIVSRIVTEHGGQIKVVNGPAGGAVFEVLLPRFEQSVEKDSA